MKIEKKLENIYRAQVNDTKQAYSLALRKEFEKYLLFYSYLRVNSKT